MAVDVATELDGILWLSADDEVAFLDEQARALLGISGDEFRRRLAAGEYPEDLDEDPTGTLLYLALLADVADGK